MLKETQALEGLWMLKPVVENLKALGEKNNFLGDFLKFLRNCSEKGLGVARWSISLGMYY